MKHTYTTVVDGTTVYAGPDLNTAIREWNRVVNSEGGREFAPSGGVAVQATDERGYLIRDGWLLHSFGEGDHRVYLNPNLLDRLAVELEGARRSTEPRCSAHDRVGNKSVPYCNANPGGCPLHYPSTAGQS
jgi:hypothetical protein